ncbi:hypothetical protein, partial [Microbacterium enclense]|uniref:hypothetical protein n=1 Tax=Microbacterium enclense TaxID=993073 RepID=UPI00341709F4
MHNLSDVHNLSRPGPDATDFARITEVVRDDVVGHRRHPRPRGIRRRVRRVLRDVHDLSDVHNLSRPGPDATDFARITEVVRDDVVGH